MICNAEWARGLFDDVYALYASGLYRHERTKGQWNEYVKGEWYAAVRGKHGTAWSLGSAFSRSGHTVAIVIRDHANVIRTTDAKLAAIYDDIADAYDKREVYLRACAVKMGWDRS